MRIVGTGTRGPLTDEVVATALADPYARRLLATCIREAKPVKDMSHHAGLPLATTYRHVKRLLDAGVLVIERSALTPDGKRYDLYRSRVRRARIELDPAGERIAWESNEAVEARLANAWDALRRQAGRK